MNDIQSEWNHVASFDYFTRNFPPLMIKTPKFLVSWSTKRLFNYIGDSSGSYSNIKPLVSHSYCWYMEGMKLYEERLRTPIYRSVRNYIHHELDGGMN